MRALAVTVGCGAALAAAADCPEASLQSASPPRTRLCEHPWVICQRLWLPYHDPPELRMLRVEQAVVLMRGEDRRHDEQTVLPSLCEFVANLGELRRCCGISPIRRELIGLNPLPAQIIVHFGDCQDKIGGSVILVEMNEVFQQGKRLVL